MISKTKSVFLMSILAAAVFLGSCTEPLDLPVVVTGNVTNVNSYSALISGAVTSQGGTALTAKGVCWSTSSIPGVEGLHSDNGATLGDFTSAISNLSSNTTYYVRAYATNADGTAYGEQITFKTTAK
jgi:hypothetical protein